MIVCSKVANHDVAIKQKAKPEVQMKIDVFIAKFWTFLPKVGFVKVFDFQIS